MNETLFARPGSGRFIIAPMRVRMSDARLRIMAPSVRFNQRKCVQNDCWFITTQDSVGEEPSEATNFEMAMFQGKAKFRQALSAQMRSETVPRMKPFSGMGSRDDSSTGGGSLSCS